MPSEAHARKAPQTDPFPERTFYTVRDECVRAYQPVNEEEMFLVTQIARAWFRLQRYYDLEAELMEQPGLMKLFETDLERFTALNRSIVSAERMWRHAVQEFQAARRRRGETGSLASPRRSSISTVACTGPPRLPATPPNSNGPRSRTFPSPLSARAPIPRAASEAATTSCSPVTVRETPCRHD